MSSKTLVIIPTYNERPNIRCLIERVLKSNDILDVLVVDDNSPDGTRNEVLDIKKEFHERVHLLVRAKKSGLGTAYIEGFKFALNNGYDVVITMDADHSHRPRYIPTFLEKIKDYDLVVGCRWIKHGGIANWPAHRVMLSRLANVYARWVLGVPLHDLTGGYNCYKREVLQSITLDKVHSDGYSFQIEMKYRAVKKGFKAAEIPIIFTDRKTGASKISRGIVLEALWIVWRLKWELNRH